VAKALQWLAPLPYRHGDAETLEPIAEGVALQLPEAEGDLPLLARFGRREGKGRYVDNLSPAHSGPLA
jgi:hypothetical protein